MFSFSDIRLPTQKDLQLFNSLGNPLKKWQKQSFRKTCEICDSKFAVGILGTRDSSDKESQEEFIFICEECYSNFCDENQYNSDQEQTIV